MNTESIEGLSLAINEIRTILLVLMEEDAAERFRREWYPKAVDE